MTPTTPEVMSIRWDKNEYYY